MTVLAAVPQPGDHPHTDPGDGRTECGRCGKYVWPVIHSCKGVPVTERARARLLEGGATSNDVAQRTQSDGPPDDRRGCGTSSGPTQRTG